MQLHVEIFENNVDIVEFAKGENHPEYVYASTWIHVAKSQIFEKLLALSKKNVYLVNDKYTI